MTHNQSVSTGIAEQRRLWLLIAFFSVFPFTAILHHAIFYRPTCMLNPFGEDYDLRVIALWLRDDPSLILAVIMATLTWAVGTFLREIRLATLAFILAFFPLSIWIWDIPLTGRVVCHLFHDGRVGLHTRHLYLLGVLLWLPARFFLSRIVRNAV